MVKPWVVCCLASSVCRTMVRLVKLEWNWVLNKYLGGSDSDKWESTRDAEVGSSLEREWTVCIIVGVTVSLNYTTAADSTLLFSLKQESFSFAKLAGLCHCLFYFFKSCLISLSKVPVFVCVIPCCTTAEMHLNTALHFLTQGNGFAGLFRQLLKTGKTVGVCLFFVSLWFDICICRN